MSFEYHKIENVWRRDEATGRLIEDTWRVPEFAYLRDNNWIATEKVDGTNIRVAIVPGGNPLFYGRTARAQIPPMLLCALQAQFYPLTGTLGELFKAVPEGDPVILYGEGYGPGINRGGWYRETPGFILFDVCIGEWWLRREDVEDIARTLQLDLVPVIATAPLPMLVSLVRGGVRSQVAQVERREAEGLVARPACELWARNGARIITKIKTHDFAEWKEAA